MLIHGKTAVMVLFLAMAPTATRAQTASDLLEKAAYQEKTAGNLDAAIKIYREIIDQDNASRPAVAMAHYRLGLCLAKKGESEPAAEAFQAVVKNFADQKGLVAAAQKELTKLGLDKSGPGTRPAGATSTAPAGKRGIALLDAETRKEVEHFEQSFRAFFRPETEYLAAAPAVKAAIVEKWMIDAKSGDFALRTRSIASLGNVRAKEAVHLLLEIVDEPMNNHRPKWLAIRSLGKIGDPTAVPALIDFVDYGNLNCKVYSRLALAELTGVYFGEDKEKWRQWWKERGTEVSAEDKADADALAARAWKAWGSGQNIEAERLFQQSLARNPGVANTWNGLGWAQLKQSRPRAAKVSFQKALDMEAAHTGALNGMAFVAKGEGKTDEAIELWKRALAGQANATAPLSGLARAYLELEQYTEAVKYFELWVKAEPKSQEAKSGLEQAKAGKKP